MNIPGFTVEKHCWTYPHHVTGETVPAACIKMTEDVEIEGPPEKTFIAYLESDGGVYLRTDEAFYSTPNSIALSAKQVAALRILFAAEIPKP